MNPQAPRTHEAPKTEATEREISQFRLGLFGDTQSGKTVLLTALQWAAEEGLLPPGMNLRPNTNESARYLGDRVAIMRSGQWPPGTLDTSEWVEIVVDLPDRSMLIRTKDFRGGDFGKAFYSGNREEAERFVLELFRDCSAYIFLVDPGHIMRATADDASEEAQLKRSQETGAITTALEILRKKSRNIRILHHPVAVVFTKCDLHPEVAQDPDGFARKHLRQVYSYLKKHAPGRHRFFAVSSTGSVEKEGAPPPKLLKPSKLFDPIIWSSEVHCSRIRLLRVFAAFIIITIAAVGYTWLYGIHEKAIAGVREQLPKSNDTELHSIYSKVRNWGGLTRFILTHPRERSRCRQDVVEAAYQWLQGNEISPRRDDNGNLRTTADYIHVGETVRVFTSRYTGEAKANDLSHWHQAQRERLANRLVEQLERAARDGKEAEFAEIEKEYIKVAIPALDPKHRELKRILDEEIVKKIVRLVFDMRVMSPRNVERVLERCRDAESELKKRPLHGSQLEEYVKLIRTTYGDLHKNGLKRTAQLSRIICPNNNSVKWSLELEKVKRESNKFEKPVRHEKDTFRLLGKPFEMNVFAPPKVLKFTIEASPGWSSSNHRGSSELNLLTALKQPQTVLVTDKDTKYTFVFDWGSLPRMLKYLQRIKELENQLFR
jgi:hypothetical protein